MRPHSHRTLVRCLVGAGILLSGSLASESYAENPRRQAEFERHIAALRKKVDTEEFTIVAAPPFVVIGDESAETVRERAEDIVTWAVRLLKKQYFPREPAEILDIWLFKDEESYEEHALAMFGKKPETPYGYFSPKDKALVMNIDTGGGTLVHEIVHPFIAANFPACPPWFNEGLASLYEKSTEEDGKIVGRTNWRLRGLKRAIRDEELPSFEKLCAMDHDAFYGDDRGDNYPQARYLCYYLQEHDLLEKFYQQFHAQAKKDPTGYQTLQAVLERSDMEAFQEEWEEYVLELRFR